MRYLISALITAVAFSTAAQIAPQTGNRAIPPSISITGNNQAASVTVTDAMIPITTARATTVTVTIPNRLPNVIVEDANTVVHTYFNGTALVDTKNFAWLQQGAVPQNVATANKPPSAGWFSDANYYYKAAQSAAAPTGNFTACFIYAPSDAATRVVYSTGPGVNAVGHGWVFQLAAGVPAFYATTGGVTGGVAATPNVLSVSCVGKNGGTIYLKTNGGATASIAGTIVAETVITTRLGKYATDGFPMVGWIYEAYITNTPWVEATVAALEADVLTKINPPSLSTTAANILPVGPSGMEVYAAFTNTALQSETSCVGNVVQAPWALISGAPTCVTNAGLAPDGTTTMDTWTSTVNSDLIGQGITLASTTKATYSTWLQKAATGTATLALQCGGGPTATGCTCGTSDGSACVAAAPAGVSCFARFTAVGTTNVRGWVTLTCNAAVTAVTALVAPGDYLATTGTAYFWGAQVTPTAYPMPYSGATVAAAVAIAATVPSIPLPALHVTNNWCIGVTATPGGGRAWSQPGQQRLASNFVSAAVNIFDLYTGGGVLRFDVWDSAGGSKSWAYTPGGAYTAGSTHRIVALANAGALSLYSDGVAVGSGSGAGTGLFNATVTPVQIGAQVGFTQFDGSLQRIVVKPNPSSWRDCN